ncbi:MAG: hypothetical protein V7752_00845 [Halopseudomonas sp.]
MVLERTQTLADSFFDVINTLMLTGRMQQHSVNIVNVISSIAEQTN